MKLEKDLFLFKLNASDLQNKLLDFFDRPNGYKHLYKSGGLIEVMGKDQYLGIEFDKNGNGEWDIVFSVIK